jgi:hypothetical protein
MCNCSKSIIVPKLEQLPHAIKSIGKLIVRTGLASSNIVSERLAICMKCPNINKGLSNQCTLCSCVVELKARLIQEECPAKLWTK